MDASGPFSLANKSLLITGASSGIGRQCAIRASECGANVILWGRNADRLKETEDAISRKVTCRAYPLDLTKMDAIEKAVESIKRDNVKIHGLVHSAGVSGTLPFRMVTPEKMESIFRINTVAAMHLTRCALSSSLFEPETGSIVFMASVMGTVGENGKTLYSMSKGAIIAGARSLALELAKRRIRVNSIVAGVVDTPMSRNAVYSSDPESRARVASLHPFGIGQADDVAYACMFLLSDASRWITGSNLIVDGGYTAR